MQAVRPWCRRAILRCVQPRARNRNSSEGTRRERLQLPQEGPSEPMGPSQQVGLPENATLPARRILSSRISIRAVDTAGGANQAVGAPCGLCFGGLQIVLWYQGRSRVVPGCYRGSKGAPTAILSIATAYASRPRGTPNRRQKVECRMQKGRAEPPKATPKRPQRAAQHFFL